MQYLYQNWLAAGENWSKSSVYLNIKSGEGTIRRGVHRWFTRFQLVQHYGEDDADQIIQGIKDTDPDNWMRDHPTSAKVSSSVLFLFLFRLTLLQHLFR